MDRLKPIAIIGGGLAGLTLGIALRRRSVPVTIREAGRYPRHRVCGEFISGRGQETLQRLGLLELLLAAGARPVRTAAFIAGRQTHPARALPHPALGVSRFQLDALLAGRFQELGGQLEINSRCADQQPGEAIVHASGRRSQPADSGWRWFGLKAHARQIPLTADLEMHLLDDAYVGLCRVSSDEVNVCGLFRTGRGESGQKGSTIERLSGTANSLLRERLAGAVWDPDSFCAVAGLSLRPGTGRESTGCRIGDALTMIAPVTGNGMSMAFESAELAVEPLAAYATGALSWVAATTMTAQLCDEAFARRLKWAWRLQQALFSPTLRALGSPLAFRCEPIWRLLFAATR